MKKLSSKNYSQSLILMVVVVAAMTTIGLYLLRGSQAAELNKSSTGSIASDQDLMIKSNKTIFYYWDSDVTGCSQTNGGQNCDVPAIQHNPPVEGIMTSGQYNITESRLINAWSISGNHTDEGYAWTGPGLDMPVPSDMQGIRGCFRYAYINNGQSSQPTDVIIALVATVSNETLSLANATTKIKPSNQAGTTTRTCVQAHTSSGSLAKYGGKFNNINLRLKIDTKLGSDYQLQIIRSSLGYY